MLAAANQLQPYLQNLYRDAPLDAAAFYRNYTYCDIGDCKGHCCAQGVVLVRPEVPFLKQTLETHSDFLVRMGAPLTDSPLRFIEEGGWHETDVVPFDYPPGSVSADFRQSTCNFRTPTGACSLQMLSTELGHADSWWLKPTWCQLFPLSFLDNRGNACITILPSTNDIKTQGENSYFSDRATCGRACKTDGEKAYIILAREIAAASELLARDLMAEIKAYNP